MYDALRKEKVYVTEKVCTSCNKLLHRSNFPVSKRNSFGLASHCKGCKIRNYPYEPSKKKLIHLRNRYGVEWSDIEKLYKQQNNSCEICKKQINLMSKDTHIDHCHTTNKMRGILCGNCNRGLGQFKDNVSSLKTAILYLEKYSGGKKEIPA